MTIAVCVFLCVIAAFYIYVAVARSQVRAQQPAWSGRDGPFEDGPLHQRGVVEDG